jgi:hypothetical protein
MAMATINSMSVKSRSVGGMAWLRSAARAVGAGTIGVGSIGAGAIGAGSLDAGSISVGAVGAGAVGVSEIGGGSLCTDGVPIRDVADSRRTHRAIP